jgi:hypothetical protein
LRFIEALTQIDPYTNTTPTWHYFKFLSRAAALIRTNGALLLALTWAQLILWWQPCAMESRSACLTLRVE